ncbi:RagB/SusD family nutrient uptake outer membrane protein [Mangrovibacterium marinum]|uniref:RagB/SusD family nutrient uptake outer membrane protein n=1 Tax=Mangrovibacterium marinum TaxID=1639118 RepID=UPI002A188E34|nr:RagB/SusD family nutrient uptake outer membrane protein [Mangrovibacterium marinum]
MKSLSKFLSISLLLILTFSCKDFLEEDNKSNITAENYFTSESGFESLVNSAYGTLRSAIGSAGGSRGYPYLFCSGVDIYNRGESELVGGTYENRDVYSAQLNEYGSLDAENQFISNFYTDFYYAIQVCNTAISRADNAGGISDSRKEQLLAETKVLRAFYYYNLVEQFGDIPLVTEEITAAVTHFERTTEEQVYQFIISELEASADNLPSVPSEFGRVTKGAANHLLSLVYLTRGYKSFADANDFSNAASLADAVISSGTYSLQNSFAAVFDRDNETNNEIILSIQYAVGPGLEGSLQSRQFGWLLNDKESGFAFGDLTYPLQYAQFTPSQYLYGLYNTSIDSRYEGTFNSEYYATADVPALGINKGDLRVYFPKPDQPFTTQDSLDFMAQHPVANIITKSRWLPDIQNLGGSGKFPMIWKFHDPSTTDVYVSTRDIILFRLAETYLIAAEAYYKMGDNAKAKDRINAVRTRAALPGNGSAMEIQASDVNIDFILDERARELAGEYKRWYDLKRTGKLVERTLMHNVLAKRANALTSKHLLRPIPQSVIDRDSGEFLQNPGY